MAATENPKDTTRDGKRRHPPLKTIGDVKRELAKLYWQGKNGQVVVSDASKLANILSLLGRLIEGNDLEERISTLEGHVREGKL